MPADFREMLHRAALRDESGPDIETVLARAGRLRAGRRTVVTGVAALAPLMILAALLLPDRIDVGLVGAPPGTILEIPDSDEGVRAAFLEDGTPVFVANLGAVEAAVLDARVPYQPLGERIDLLVAWCPPSGRFQEPRYGSEFAPDGTHLNGPAPTGLLAYRLAVEQASQVRVQERGSPRPRSEDPGASPMRGPECAPAGTGPAKGRWHYAEDTDRAPSPREALTLVSDGRVVVRGTLEYVGSQPPEMCDDTGAVDAGVEGPQCHRPHSLSTVLPALDDDPDRYRGYQGVLVLEVASGEVVGVTLTAGVRVYGGWTGEQVTRGILRPTDAGVSVALGAPRDARPDVHVELDDGEFAGLFLTDEVTIIGRSLLTGTHEPQPVTRDQLIAAARADHPIPLEITMRRMDQTIVRVEELPR